MSMSPRPEPSEQSRAVGHESDEIGGRPILFASAGLIALVVGSLVGLSMLLRVFTRNPRVVDAPRSIIAGERSSADAPPLQPSVGHDSKPEDDLVALRASEDAVFDHLGWKRDAATNRPRIPDEVVSRVANRATPQASTEPSR